MEPKLKRKYRSVAHGTFKSKTSSGGGGVKRFYRADGSEIARPRNAKWARHIDGHWWGGRPKGRHVA